MSTISEAEMRQLFRELGQIKERLDQGKSTHERFEAQLIGIRHDLAELSTVGATVRKMEPIVKDYEENKWRAAGVFLVLSIAVGTLVTFAKQIWQAITG
jgi:hypothetical protein